MTGLEVETNLAFFWRRLAQQGCGRGRIPGKRMGGCSNQAAAGNSLQPTA